jgi:hypothetical protein
MINFGEWVQGKYAPNTMIEIIGGVRGKGNCYSCWVLVEGHDRIAQATQEPPSQFVLIGCVASLPGK